MEAYRTEEEQIEAISKFFNEYGTKILAIIVTCVALFFGYQYWTKTKLESLEKASNYYNELNLSVSAGEEITPEDRAKFDGVFANLLKEYPKSLYASYASLIKAKLDVEAGNLDKAAQSLQWVIDAKVNAEIVTLANLRLARVEFALGNADKALALLEKDSAPFTASYEEIRGDIYAEKKEAAKALIAYKKAKELRPADSNAFTKNILDMKIASVESGTSSAKAVAETKASSETKAP